MSNPASHPSPHAYARRTRLVYVSGLLLIAGSLVGCSSGGSPGSHPVGAGQATGAASATGGVLPAVDPAQLQSSKTNWVFFSIWTQPYPETCSTVAELQKVYSSSYVVSRDGEPNLR